MCFLFKIHFPRNGPIYAVLDLQGIAISIIGLAKKRSPKIVSCKSSIAAGTALFLEAYYHENAGVGLRYNLTNQRPDFKTYSVYVIWEMVFMFI